MGKFGSARGRRRSPFSTTIKGKKYCYDDSALRGRSRQLQLELHLNEKGKRGGRAWAEP